MSHGYNVHDVFERKSHEYTVMAKVSDPLTKKNVYLVRSREFGQEEGNYVVIESDNYFDGYHQAKSGNPKRSV